MTSLSSFQDILAPLFGIPRRGGGRKATQPHMPSLNADSTIENASFLSPPSSDQQSRLTIVQITDVYTLDHFASLKTMLKDIREKHGNADNVVSMLTGDFLSPYLLSSVDRGAGMMHALAETPIDILTWGNHEADIDHRTVCKHVKNWPGVFVNSNMQSHQAMEYQVPYHIVEVKSPDGTQTRKIGFIAVLSNDPKLYQHFKAPGAFGGAKIEDPWETLRKYDKILKEEHKCDLVIPLEHLYCPENYKTCREFDFPLILSGHDHHRIDEVVNGTRLVKPGMDAVYAAVIEIVWDDNNQDMPTIKSTFVETSQWEPCPVLKEKTDRAYDVLLPLRNTELAGIPPAYRPLTSKNARGSVCSMGKLICSLLKSSINQRNEGSVDAVIIMGGNIRANEDYPDDSFFSLETLEAEIKSNEVIGIVPIPGSVLEAGIVATHAGDPIPGWMQYDDGIIESGKAITHVSGKPLDPNKIYQVATKISDLTNGQSPPLKEYFLANPDVLPSKGDYVNIQTELMGFFARNLWRKLWEATGEVITDMEESLNYFNFFAGGNGSDSDLSDEKSDDGISTGMESRLRLSILDRNGDGYLTVEDIHSALKKFLGLSVHDNEMTLAECIHSYADVTGTGQLTVEDFEHFCSAGNRAETKVDPKWKEAFPDPIIPPTSITAPMLVRRMSSPKLGRGKRSDTVETDATDVSSLGDGTPRSSPNINRHRRTDTEVSELTTLVET